MEESSTSFTGELDVYEQLLLLYGESGAPQHRRLCQTAAAIHSSITAKSLPFTPLSYFNTIIDALSGISNTTQTYDVDGLCSFLAIVLELVPSIDKSKASEAAVVLNKLVCNQYGGLLALVKCCGKLLQFCDLEDWESIELGFKTLLKHSIHRSPKVRILSQEYVVNIFKALQSSYVKKSASKAVLESFSHYISLGVETAGSRSNDDEIANCQYLEVLRMFDVLKLLIPCLPRKYVSKAIKELQESLSVEFSPLTMHVQFTPMTMHVLNLMEEILRIFESDAKLTMVDTLKIPKKWNRCYSLIVFSITELLAYEPTAARSEAILTELIGRVSIYGDEGDDGDDGDEGDDGDDGDDGDEGDDGDDGDDGDEGDDGDDQSRLVKSLCNSLLEVLRGKEIPNGHSCSVISKLFEDLGTDSNIFMREILVRLASFMSATGDVKHLHECIGMAVTCMRPENVLSLIPIALNPKDFTCSNTWLLPIVKEYTIASSMGFFKHSILPLAESLQEAHENLQVEKNSVIRKQMHTYARGCWALLSAFCRQPDDMDVTFDDLAEHLMLYINKDAFMLEDIAIALQRLVKRNTNKSFRDDYEVSESITKWYKISCAAGNIKALSSWSKELLKAFVRCLFEVSPEKVGYIKDTIACLALITDASVVKEIFISSVKETKPDVSVDLVASAFVGETNTDPADFIYDSIMNCVQEAGGDIKNGTYASIYKILEESSKFRSSKFEQVAQLLLGSKSPDDVTALKQRFLCFKTLLVHCLIKIKCERENKYVCCMLDEILGTLTHSNEGRRQVAEDTLLDTSSILQEKTFSSKTGPYCRFLTMIMGHLSGHSSSIESSAVSALAVLTLMTQESAI